jgi:DNA-directed RNA polymerase specialized sigma24 family protein
VSNGRDDLAEAVEKLLDHLDGRASFEDQDWQVVLSALTRVVRSGRYEFTRDEAVEIATTAVTQFLAAARGERFDRARGGVGYLVQITRNEAATVSRRQRTQPILEPLPEDVEVAATESTIDDLVNALGDSSRVQALLRTAIADGRHELASFIRVFLDQADERRPTLRQLGEALDLSPSTISSRIDELHTLVANL